MRNLLSYGSDRTWFWALFSPILLTIVYLFLTTPWAPCLGFCNPRLFY
jgi:hypothetical protein